MSEISCKLQFKVKDNDGVWSNPVTQILKIKKKEKEKSELIPKFKLSKSKIEEAVILKNKTIS